MGAVRMTPSCHRASPGQRIECSHTLNCRCQTCWRDDRLEIGLGSRSLADTAVKGWREQSEPSDSRLGLSVYFQFEAHQDTPRSRAEGGSIEGGLTENSRCEYQKATDDGLNFR
jgi:hypothetical protein